MTLQAIELPLLDPQSAWFWVGLSLLLYATGGIILWLAQRFSSRWRAALATRVGILLAWLVRLTWLLGPGYTALLLGLVSPRLLGLSQIEIGAGLGQAVIVALLAFGVLAAGVTSVRRNRPAAPPFASNADAMAGSVRLALEAGGLQWQWTFYRAVIVAAAAAQGGTDLFYRGVWLAVALIVAQGMLNPLLWRDLRSSGTAGPRLLRAAVLVISSVLFLLSRNFWLCWAFHAVTVVLLEPRLAALDRSNG